MSSSNPGFLERFKKYHFELKHLLVIFFVLVFFLILISFVHKTTLQELLVNTQDWLVYQGKYALIIKTTGAASIAPLPCLPIFKGLAM